MTGANRSGLAGRRRLTGAVFAATILVTAAATQTLDRTQTAAETASLSGVVRDETGAPVRLAIVTLTGDALALARSRISGDEGRFVFEELPAGRFTLMAEKAAHVRNSYGSRRPGRPGTLLSLGEGERRAGIDLRLPRGAVITGVVRDPLGRPAPGVEVAALPVRSAAGTRLGSFVIVDGVLTDDRGEYRIFGLSPGEYYLTGGIRHVGSGAVGQTSAQTIDRVFEALEQGRPAPDVDSGPDARRATAYVPTYYPGTGDPAAATAIAVDVGEVREGADFPLVLVPSATISGTVSGPPDIPLTAVRVTVQGTGTQRMTVMTSLGLGFRASRSEDGTAFTIAGVPPGRYEVTAVWEPSGGTRGRAGSPIVAIRSGRPGRGGGAGAGPTEGEMHWARTDITVTGDDIPGLALSLQPGLKVSGRVAFEGADRGPEGADTRPEGFEALRLSLGSMSPQATVGMAVVTRSSSTADVAEDLTFEFPGMMPGVHEVSARFSARSDWWLRSATAGGRDVLDYGLDVSGPVSDLVVTFTRQRTELSGTLTTAEGEPAPGHFIIVFPADQAMWRPGARRVKATRPADDGRYVFENLPAGDYRIAALTDVEDGEWEDPAFLATLLPASLEVSLADGEARQFDIRTSR